MKVRLEEIWKVEQEILDEVDRVCNEHHLKYSLAYGTLIGAVRHNGFIPWDDDIDIIMPVDDYNKLLSIWDNSAQEGYLLQNKITHGDFNQNFSKIRKEHTTFIQHEFEKSVSYSTGIFVDIFPGHYIPKKRIFQKFQKVACAVNLLMARDHGSGNNDIRGIAEQVLLSFPDCIKKKIYVESDSFIQSWNRTSSCGIFFPSTIGEVAKRYSIGLFDNMTTIPFNGKEYMCISEYKKMLEYDYGDYMKLPPEEDRVLKHHPLVVDIERSYDEIRENRNVE